MRWPISSSVGQLLSTSDCESDFACKPGHNDALASLQARGELYPRRSCGRSAAALGRRPLTTALSAIASACCSPQAALPAPRTATRRFAGVLSTAGSGKHVRVPAHRESRKSSKAGMSSDRDETHARDDVQAHVPDRRSACLRQAK